MSGKLLNMVAISTCGDTSVCSILFDIALVSIQKVVFRALSLMSLSFMFSSRSSIEVMIDLEWE